MQKLYKIKVDISKKYAMPAFEVNTNDLKSIRLSIEVLNGSSPLDLNDKTVRIAIRKPDNNIVFQDCEVKDAAAGQVEVILENQAYITPGTHTAEIMCYKGSDVVAVSGTFSYKSTKGIMNDEAVESKSEFTAITLAINEAKQLLEDAIENGGGGGAGIDEQARQNIQEITTQLEELEQKVEEGGVGVDEQARREIQEVSAALADIAISTKPTQPFYVETMVSFGKYGNGSPSGLANYTGGNYSLKVTGVSGQDYLTVTEGNIADAGVDNKWFAVILNKDKYIKCQVTTYDGNKLYIYPSLNENVNGYIYNVHDGKNGQHYTEHGYKALADHIFYYNAFSSQRKHYIDRVDPYIGREKLVRINGLPSVWADNRTVVSTDKLVTLDNDRILLFSPSAANQGFEWEIELNREIGYFETVLGVHTTTGNAKIQVYLDGKLEFEKTVNKTAERVAVKFNNNKKGKVIITGDTASMEVKVSHLTWWIGNEVNESLFTKNDKVGYLGDSWGVYHNKATTRQLEKRLNEIGNTNPIINLSAGGMTTKYGLAWLPELIKQGCTKIIFEYFTNDINCIAGGNQGMNFTKPDGTTDNTFVSESDYYNNISHMTKMCLDNGIQPIFLLPAPVEWLTQTQNHAKYGWKIASGNSELTNLSSSKFATTLNALQTASVEQRGKLIIREENGVDVPYLCVQTAANTYAWKKLTLV